MCECFRQTDHTMFEWLFCVWWRPLVNSTVNTELMWKITEWKYYWISLLESDVFFVTHQNYSSDENQNIYCIFIIFITFSFTSYNKLLVCHYFIRELSFYLYIFDVSRQTLLFENDVVLRLKIIAFKWIKKKSIIKI